MGKKTNQYLEKLGGVRVYVYGEGDDNSSLEDDFNAWKEKIWPAL
jgi:NADPH-ferrihemoprotein reductase